jgi:zinc protease
MKTTFIKIVCFLVAFLSITITAQKVDRTKPPQLPPPQELKVAPVQKFELSNGLKVYLMEKHEVPLVQLNVIVKTGTVNDPENKTGLANMMMDMMDEGAAGKTALQLADEIDFLGASITTGAGIHTSGIYLHTMLSKFEPALKVMGDIILKPDFPQAELDRKKKDRLTSIMQAHDQPTAIANISFNKLLFGDKHPYGKPAVGNEASIKSFTSNDLNDFNKKYFFANNAFVVAVGDIKKEVLKKKLEAVFGKWPKGNLKEEKISEAAQVENRVVYIIDKPGAPQSVISIGKIGASRFTPDYNQLVVMNTILGGSFTSRLNNNLREEHGYTYGASSRFAFRLVPGSFIASSSVQTEVTDKALTEFFKELNGIREPIPETELTRGKNLVALSYPGGFQSITEIAGQIEEMINYDLPVTYFNDYVGKMLSVNGSEVNAAAKKYIVPEKMIVVVVGDKSKIEAGIKALNLGEIKNYTIEDMLGKIPKTD